MSRKSRRSRNSRKRLRGGSGASLCETSFMSGETTFCPDGKVEVPHIPTNGVEKAGPIGINDVNKSFTKIEDKHLPIVSLITTLKIVHITSYNKYE